MFLHSTEKDNAQAYVDKRMWGLDKRSINCLLPTKLYVLPSFWNFK